MINKPNYEKIVRHTKSRLIRIMAEAPSPLYQYWAMEDALKELKEELILQGFQETLPRYQVEPIE
jgi:hypothetical protein